VADAAVSRLLALVSPAAAPAWEGAPVAVPESTAAPAPAPVFTPAESWVVAPLSDDPSLLWPLQAVNNVKLPQMAAIITCFFIVVCIVVIV
jgi:hypothetical protein